MQTILENEPTGVSPFHALLSVVMSVTVLCYITYCRQSYVSSVLQTLTVHHTRVHCIAGNSHRLFIGHILIFPAV